MPRIPIDKIYMKIAYDIAQLSYAERRKVGCIIVKDDDQIISFGYNGTPHNFDNVCEDIFYGENNPKNKVILKHEDMSIKTSTKPEVLHAESNAIAKLAKSTLSSKGAKLYITMSPCYQCAKLIIQSGIVEVFYDEQYRDCDGIELLKKANIKVTKLNPIYN